MKITAYNEQHHLALSGAIGTTAYSAAQAGTALGSNTPLVESGAGTPGSGPQASAWDHVHPAVAGGTAASTVTSETTYGLTPAVGVGTAYAREDHTHGSPSTSALATAGFRGELLISDTPSTPLVFADLIQDEAQGDFLYADV